VEDGEVRSEAGREGEGGREERERKMLGSPAVIIETCTCTCESRYDQSESRGGEGRKEPTSIPSSILTTS